MELLAQSGFVESLATLQIGDSHQTRVDNASNHTKLAKYISTEPEVASFLAQRVIASSEMREV
jgi:hypothetical protein